MTEKADQLKHSLKIAVKRRGNLRRMFTNEGKKLAPIFDKAAEAEIAEEDIEQLKAGQQKLLDVRPAMRQMDKEIQNLHAILGEEDTEDQDFVDTDNISDTHSALLRQIEKLLLRAQQLQSSESIPHANSSVSKQLKHSALKLPKMALPVFDGDRRKWLSFWDVFKSEVHDVKDISKVTKFNFLKGQLSEQVKMRLGVSWPLKTTTICWWTLCRITMVTKLLSKMLIVLLSLQWLSHSTQLQLCAPSMTVL